MHWNPLRWNIDDIWLWVKRLVLFCAYYGAVFAAFMAFMVALMALVGPALAWLKTGTWGSGRTVADAWPALAYSVATTKWIGVQRIGLSVIAQQAAWAYVVLGLALGFVGIAVSASLLDTLVSLELRWQQRASRFKAH